MKLNLIQRTPEWHKWRSGIIGASDVPVIMGVSPFRNATALNLWKEKLGMIEPKDTTVAMQRGIDGESRALQAYMDFFNVYLVPACFESDEYAFMGCSLDGITQDGDTIVEIKVPGDHTLELARRGQIEPHYLYQIQYQLFVTKAKKAYFYAFNDYSGIGYRIEVNPDPELWALMVEAVKAFWQCIITRMPPGYTVINNNLLNEKAHEAYKVKEEIKSLESRYDKLKEEIEGICPSDKVICGNFRLEKSQVAGRIDYTRIDLLNTVDLELYRKPSTTMFKIVKEA